MPEYFKGIEEVEEPDPRNLGYGVLNSLTGETRELGLEDVHRGLTTIVLNTTVPQDIQDHFVTAKHLALYSWYVYRFVMPSQLQAYATLEYALRERITTTKREGLKALLAKATAQGLVHQHLIRDWPGHNEQIASKTPSSSAKWLESLPEFISVFRNDLAHGSFTLWPDGGRTLRIVADIVNHLYPASDS